MPTIELCPWCKKDSATHPAFALLEGFRVTACDEAPPSAARYVFDRASLTFRMSWATWRDLRRRGVV